MSVPTEEITKERFARWAKRFAECKATPLLAIGMGHEENRGQIVMTTLENEELDIRTLRALLAHALSELGHY